MIDIHSGITGNQLYRTIPKRYPLVDLMSPHKFCIVILRRVKKVGVGGRPDNAITPEQSVTGVCTAYSIGNR